MTEKDKFISHFREAQPNFSRSYAIILTKIGLTLPQYALLNHLAAAGTAQTMTHLSKKLHISKPAVTNLTDRLEKIKCIKRLAHPKDRRIYLLQLQPRGKKVVQNIQTRVLWLLLKSFDQFNIQERKIIRRFYAALSQTITNALIQKS